jgi:predicted site-specific integrase-resolvase
MDDEYVTTKKAAEILSCVPRTLRNMDRDGRIQTIRTEHGQRKYNIKEYINRTRPNQDFKPKVACEKLNVCYCRVSSRGQKDDLERQVDYIKEKYPSHTIIKDIGSGLNFKRKGLQTLLDLSFKGSLGEIVVTYKDRLCRFGFELLQDVFKRQSDSKIVVLNQSIGSPESELANDIIQILTVFSAKVHGLRKYRNSIKEDKDIPKSIST